MTLAAPPLLVLGAVVVAALVVVAVVFGRRRAAALARLGVAPAAGGGRDGRGGRGGRGTARQLGVWLTIAGVGVLAVGAAGPAASVPTARASGTVVLAMDVSQSMSATDVSPSRLAAAQKAAKRFIAAQPSSVDIGVVAFEDGALVTAKPSPDHDAAASAVDRLRISGGTSLSSAIIGSLATISGKRISVTAGGKLPDLGWLGSSTIVIFSDGQDMGGAGDGGAGDSGGSGDTGSNGSGAAGGETAALQAASQLAANSSVHIDTIGVGTTAGTTVEVDGYRLATALDESTLKAIAKTTDGTYHPASDAAQLGNAAKSIDLRLTVANRQLPLAGAFIAVALALLLAGAALTVARTGRVV